MCVHAIYKIHYIFPIVNDEWKWSHNSNWNISFSLFLHVYYILIKINIKTLNHKRVCKLNYKQIIFIENRLLSLFIIVIPLLPVKLKSFSSQNSKMFQKEQWKSNWNDVGKWKFMNKKIITFLMIIIIIMDNNRDQPSIDDDWTTKQTNIFLAIKWWLRWWWWWWLEW